MSAVDDILSAVPFDQLAASLGVDAGTAEQAARAAVPTLLAGLQANAEDPAGAASLEGALSDHNTGLLDGGVDLAAVDTTDGAKIVQNIFGSNTDAVVNTLAGGGAQQQSLLQKLLPILAPVVLAYLAQKMFNKKPAEQTSAGAPEQASGGGLLGGLFGGGEEQQAPAQEQRSGGNSGAFSNPNQAQPGQVQQQQQAPAQEQGGGLDIGSILGGLLGGGKR